MASQWTATGWVPPGTASLLEHWFWSTIKINSDAAEGIPVVWGFLPS